jgi:hypothetical protein
VLSDRASESISRATRQSESWKKVIDEFPGSPLTLKGTCFVLVFTAPVRRPARGVN